MVDHSFAEKFLSTLEKKKGKYFNWQIICHNDADGICSALLAQQFFPTERILPLSNDEVKKLNFSKNVLYLFLDIQPPKTANNIFIIDHHSYKKKQAYLTNQIFVQDVTTILNANAFLVEFIAEVQRGGTDVILTHFADTISRRLEERKDESNVLRLKLLVCAIIGNNSHLLEQESSVLAKFPSDTQRMFLKLRGLSLALTFEVAHKNKGIRAGFVHHIYTVFKNREKMRSSSVKALVLKDYYKAPQNLIKFSRSLAEQLKKLPSIGKTTDYSRKPFFIFLNTEQENVHVKGIFVNYLLPRLKEFKADFIVLERKGKNTGSWSSRIQPYDLALLVFDGLFKKYDNQGGGRKNVGGGTLTNIKPPLNELLTTKTIDKLKPVGWDFVVITGNLLEKPNVYAGHDKLSNLLRKPGSRLGF